MAFSAFLKIEGVDGESMDDNHKNWIEVLSYKWSVDQSQSPIGDSGSSQPAKFSAFSIVKSLDIASPKLALSVASGEHFSSAILQLNRTGNKQPLVQEYTLTDVVVTSYSPSGQGGGTENRPAEEVTLIYGKIEWKYFLPKGGGTVSGGWDIKTNKKV